jgi:hypothetical protein
MKRREFFANSQFRSGVVVRHTPHVELAVILMGDAESQPFVQP